MEEVKRKKYNKGGRPSKSDPAKNCVMVRFSDQEYAQFLSMFEESGVYAKATFIKARVFKQSFHVVKTDKGAIEYISKLTQLYAQFRAIGVNYNQIVKQLHSHYSEKAALSMLYKLEKITIELVTTNQQIIELTQRFEQEYLKRR
ncbi:MULTISPECIES: conjugal transfer protein MobA [unclassified Dysgonomonas]|uniref:conjugal transfer protein MobA n=1 Tax=unclassified Dysgonomonas TaxID=2630389 RepID=UPI0025C5B951|nr:MULTISPECIES: conjugal transfer protein MobA [unclassified Dysgonomonas]